MGNRRSLSAALELSAEKMAFIRGEGAASEREPESTQVSSLQPAQEQPVSALPEPAPRKPSGRDTGRKKVAHLLPSEDESIVWIPNMLVPLTTRLQPTTAAALKRAGLEQKLRGQNPGTVQEIAEAAIQSWLREFGYLS
jgi:hypothetical protein